MKKAARVILLAFARLATLSVDRHRPSPLPGPVRSYPRPASRFGHAGSLKKGRAIAVIVSWNPFRGNRSRDHVVSCKEPFCPAGVAVTAAERETWREAESRVAGEIRLAEGERL